MIGKLDEAGCIIFTNQNHLKMKDALIIEDDPHIADLLQIHLKDLNFRTDIVEDGRRGLRKAQGHPWDIIVLDLMLPSLDGLEICRTLRKRDLQTPIVMLTARSEEIDKVLGLETGADDYITKPFSVREFQARVKALMRRSQSQSALPEGADARIEAGDLTIDPDMRLVTKRGKRLELTPKEFDLLTLLALNPGKSYNRQDLLNLVWGYDFIGFEHTVNSHINRLRAKIEDDMAQPEYILTTWGYGYRFTEQN